MEAGVIWSRPKSRPGRELDDVVELGHELGELRVVGEDICFGDRELPVEDGEELALDPANVALAEDTGAHGPVNVLQRAVVGVLGAESACGNFETLRDRVY